MKNKKRIPEYVVNKEEKMSEVKTNGMGNGNENHENLVPMGKEKEKDEVKVIWDVRKGHLKVLGPPEEVRKIKEIEEKKLERAKRVIARHGYDSIAEKFYYGFERTILFAEELEGGYRNDSYATTVKWAEKREQEIGEKMTEEKMEEEKNRLLEYYGYTKKRIESEKNAFVHVYGYDGKEMEEYARDVCLYYAMNEDLERMEHIEALQGTERGKLFKEGKLRRIPKWIIRRYNLKVDEIELPKSWEKMTKVEKLVFPEEWQKRQREKWREQKRKWREKNKKGGLKNEGLKIRIPRKFKRALSRRFSPTNAFHRIDRWIIDKRCPLCEEYKECSRCPFEEFNQLVKKLHDYHTPPCLFWLKKVVGISLHSFLIGTGKIYWWDDKDDEARKELLLLKRKARKFIEWI